MNKSVLLFLAQGFEIYEASAFTDIFGWSRIVGSPNPVNLITTALRSEVKCTWNLTVKPEIDFEKIDPCNYDALAIPGGFPSAGFYEDAYDERFLALIRDFDKENKVIAAVCSGSMAVGKSGVLKKRAGTSYDLLNGIMKEQMSGFGVNIKDDRIVVDRNIITSTGPSTAVDVAFILLEMMAGKKTVDFVRKSMRF